MGTFLSNQQLEHISKNVYDFIIKYKTVILITFFIGVLVNAVDVFTVKFGIDSEIYALENSPKIYFESQRYGSWLLYYLLPFARYHIISQLIGIFALTIAALLTVSRHNISNNAKLLFMLLFVTYPNFAFLQYFYYQSAYNFTGLLFTVIAYRLIEKNSIIAYIFAVILLLIGISSYQANAAIFVSVIMINVVLDYINDKDIKPAIKNIVKPVLLLILTLLVYYVIIKLVNNNLNSYHSQFIHYSGNYINTIGNLFTHIYRKLISFNEMDYTANIFVSIISIISLIYLLIKHYKEKYYLLFILLIIGCILSFFAMNIFAGGSMPVRAELSLGFYPAFILLLIYILNTNKTIQLSVIVLAIFIIGYHTTYIVKYQMSYYVTYKQDEVLAQDLMNKIYNKYPEIYHGKYKINFIGRIYRQNKHPLNDVVRKNTIYLSSGKDVFNASFFDWDGGNPSRMLAFMKLLGFPREVQLGYVAKEKVTAEIMEEVKNMPVYPNNDCVKLVDDTVLVKLSN